MERIRMLDVVMTLPSGYKIYLGDIDGLSIPTEEYNEKLRNKNVFVDSRDFVGYID